MSSGRGIGRASAKNVGRARVARVHRHSPKPAAGTSVMAAPPAPAPVFVDDSGGRRRKLRLLLFATAVVIVLAAVAAWASVFVSPVRPVPPSICAATAANCPAR